MPAAAFDRFLIGVAVAAKTVAALWKASPISPLVGQTYHHVGRGWSFLTPG